jgi:hypothetical protein
MGGAALLSCLAAILGIVLSLTSLYVLRQIELIR